MDTLNTITGVTVVLEDHGQDFLEFDIQGRKIVATRPFQGAVWNGRHVINKSIVVGDRVILSTGDNTARAVNYPVVEVRPLAKVAVGPTDV